MSEEYNHSYIPVNNFSCFTTKKIDCINLNMNFSERLKAARQHAKLSQAALAELVKVSQANISKLESGDPAGSEFTVQISTACKVNPNWLATGKGSMLEAIDDEMPMFSRNVNQNTAKYKPEPIDLDNNPDYPAIRKVNIKLSAGIVGFNIDYDVEDKTPVVMRREWFEKRGYNPAKLLATKVKGDSMIPGINDSDTVVMNTEDTTPIDGDVYAVNYEGELLIKRLIRDAGVWWLSSDNPDQRRHPRKLCEGDLCLILGKIVHKQSEVI